MKVFIPRGVAAVWKDGSSVSPPDSIFPVGVIEAEIPPEWYVGAEGKWEVVTIGEVCFPGSRIEAMPLVSVEGEAVSKELPGAELQKLMEKDTGTTLRSLGITPEVQQKLAEVAEKLVNILIANPQLLAKFSSRAVLRGISWAGLAFLLVKAIQKFYGNPVLATRTVALAYFFSEQAVKNNPLLQQHPAFLLVRIVEQIIRR